MSKASTAAARAKSGDALAEKLARMGVLREEDLVLHLPLRYEDHTRIVPLAGVKSGDTVQTEGVIVSADIQYRPRRQLVCLLRDEERGDASLVLRFFSFYPSHQKALTPGTRVRVFGDVRDGYFGPEIVHPQFRVVTVDTPLPDRLTPVYPTTAGLAQDTLRKLTAHALLADAARTEETLPEDLVRKRRLWKFGDAVRFLHAPPPRLSALTQKALDARTHPAWTRLKFDELLAQQLSLKAHRKARSRRHAPVLTGTGTLTRTLLDRVPFKLTRAQERVWREISHDLKRAMPMQRLLQGDVGSGKTIVAALAALQAIESGRQVAFMAPTEILAEQHWRKLSSWLTGVGIDIAWLSGSLPAKQRRKTLDALASGKAPFAIGTHALFQEGVAMPQLGLAIVDEQHRFGVAQRLALRDKGLAEAHQLMMSATPIPRTLAMTFYADLDVSAIDEMPPGRTPVTTRLVSQKRRAEIVAWVGKACGEGRQVYWVCPLIEESEKLELQTAVALHAELTRAFASMPQIHVGLLHGRMKSDEKGATMDAFVARWHPGARRDDGDRSRRRRAECVDHGDRACRAVRARATASAAWPHRARVGAELLRAAVRGAARRHGQAAPEGHLRDDRRLRDRAPGPADPRSRRIPGRAPVRHAAAALRGPGARRRADRAGARCGGRVAAKRPGGSRTPSRPLARR